MATSRKKKTPKLTAEQVAQRYIRDYEVTLIPTDISCGLLQMPHFAEDLIGDVEETLCVMEEAAGVSQTVCSMSAYDVIRECRDIIFEHVLGQLKEADAGMILMSDVVEEAYPDENPFRTVTLFVQWYREKYPEEATVRLSELGSSWNHNSGNRIQVWGFVTSQGLTQPAKFDEEDDDDYGW